MSVREQVEAVFVFIAQKIGKLTGLTADDSAKRRYLGGMKPDKYYDEVVYPDLKETFEILGFKYDKGKEVRDFVFGFRREGRPTLAGP